MISYGEKRFLNFAGKNDREREREISRKEVAHYVSKCQRIILAACDLGHLRIFDFCRITSTLISF